MFNTLNDFLDSQSNVQAEENNTLYTLSPTVPDVMTKFYKNLELLGYNLDELRPALDQNGTSLIISCAGSGKTTFLELKLIHDYLSGELFVTRQVMTASGVMEQSVLARVFISTFLKSGAEELKTSFDEKVTELKVQGICADNLVFSTLHAEYYAILTELGIKINIMAEEDCNAALSAACKTLGIRNRMHGYGGGISRDELMDVACIVGYARNRIDEARYSHPLCEEYGLTAPVLEKLIELYHKHRVAVNAYDFEDLQELVYQGITNNADFRALVASRYEYVFIDEFQDTSQIQYEVLKAYISGAKKTVAIGDDDQCIYSWRGSDVDIITKHFPADYNPVIHKFTVNYRCRANILAPVIPSIKRNKNRYDKDLTAYRDGGLVTVSQTCDVDALMTEVRGSVANAYRVGILSRTNFDLLAPAILLELDGTIPFSLSRSAGITSTIPRQVFGALKLFTRRYCEDFEYILKAFLPRASQYEAGKLCDVLSTQPQASIYSLPEEDLRYSCGTLYYIVLKPIRSAANPIDAYLELLKYLSEEVYKGTSPFSVRARLFVSFVRDLILHHHTIKALDISEIEELFTSVIPNKLNKRAYSKGKTSVAVSLTTVHEAKGKEWDSVIIWNDTAGVFPAVVGKHILTDAEFEEERRLHYIAFTRAKERLTVFTSATSPSPYLLECDFKATVAVKVEGVPCVETAALPDKAVTVGTDNFRECLTQMMNPDGYSEDSNNAMMLVQYYQYDIERVLSELRNAHIQLKNAGDFDSFDSFADEMNLCVVRLLNTIQDTLCKEQTEV